MKEEIMNDENLEEVDSTNVTLEQQALIEGMKKIKDPFKMLKTEDVAKDLDIGISKAYAIFNSEDFPAVKVGGQKRIARLAYALWKIKNIERMNK